MQEVYGLDLTQEWKMRRWRKLLNCIDRLRRTSHLHEEMSQDDELADLIVKHDKGGSSKPVRRMSEFSAEVEVLTIVADRLAEVAQAVYASRGAKARRVEPLPRPETAYARARRRRAEKNHAFTVARVFGYIDKDGNPTGRQPDETNDF